jgi:hypothetical protein
MRRFRMWRKQEKAGKKERKRRITSDDARKCKVARMSEVIETSGNAFKSAIIGIRGQEEPAERIPPILFLLIPTVPGPLCMHSQLRVHVSPASSKLLSTVNILIKLLLSRNDMVFHRSILLSHVLTQRDTGNERRRRERQSFHELIVGGRSLPLLLLGKECEQPFTRVCETEGDLLLEMSTTR